MTRFLLGALVGAAIASLVEGYTLIGVVQRMRSTFEQLLTAAQDLLAAIPGKSAERTDAPEDVQPRRWFRALRRVADDVDDELGRWEDDGGAPDEPTAPIVAPATDEMERIDLVGGLRLPTPQPEPEPQQVPAVPVADDVDAKLARFTYAEGYRR